MTLSERLNFDKNEADIVDIVMTYRKITILKMG
jgi:hypothetical protein